MRGDVVNVPPQNTSSTGNRITLAEVAEVAGVSKITVSRALRGSDLVKPVVRDRIQAAASALGYRVNLAARDLRLRQRMRIAVVIDMAASDERPLFDPYPLALLGGIMHECAAAGFAAVLTTNDPRVRAEAHDTSGIIVLGQGAHHEAVRALATLNLPLVVWGANDGVEARMGAAVVGSDNRQGGALAAEYLLDKRRRVVAFLGDTDHAEVADRAAGFRDRLRRDGVEVAAARNCDFTSESGRRAMEDLLAKEARIDGVFAGSDLVAIGAIQALHQAGRQPGSDISVVGYDDMPVAAASNPRLTTIRQDWTRGGRLLAQTLLTRLGSYRVPQPLPQLLPVQLVVRET
jgi:DNA-binding LacI/PurR family transcriptional regulator